MWKLFGIAASVALMGASHVRAGDTENSVVRAGNSGDSEFFERRIRPMLVNHCYECHSEAAGEQQGSLLLDRQSGWLEGGETGKAVVPNDLESSLLIAAIRYSDDLQMPPDAPLSQEQVELFEHWVRLGAPAPEDDMGETDFSRLGDQDYLFDQAKNHWAFQPVSRPDIPSPTFPGWEVHPIDRFVSEQMADRSLSPSPQADARTIVRRLFYDLAGLPPTIGDVQRFREAYLKNSDEAIEKTVDQLIDSPGFGQHVARMWLDVARYADTDSAYRPDTKTPHYFPFAFTYRDYVVDSFNDDKPFDRFLTEQIAADLLGLDDDAPELAALGFFGVGPHANRAQAEALDDWIDVTTRGLMGVTAACARCHDHKFEPVPTADYYALRGVFAALTRINPLDEKRQPEISGYQFDPDQVADYEKRREEIEAKVQAAAGQKAKNNNRSIPQKIRETELAELLLFHPGAPARAMVVAEKKIPPPSYILIRGDAGSRGDQVPRRFLSILDPEGTAFSDSGSGRLELAASITDPDNPLTARVFVNRVWGHLVGSHLVATPSDFGLQGSVPTHPDLLDWMTSDFIQNGWSVKHLVRSIVKSRTYLQSSDHRDEAASIDPENRLLWRANRQHLHIESIRDSMLAVSDRLDHRMRGHAEKLWGKDHTTRRAIYGYVNRFNLDPTLRAFDFPSPMQTQAGRGESIVAQQALFTMNSPFVIDQANGLVDSSEFANCESDEQRIEYLFERVYQRKPVVNETARVLKFVEFQKRLRPVKRFINSPWPLVAQSLLMSNEFQYVD